MGEPYRDDGGTGDTLAGLPSEYTNYLPDELTTQVQAAWEFFKDRASEIADMFEEKIELRRQVPVYGLPDPSEQNPDDDCAAINQTLKRICVEIARQTEVQRAGFTGVGLSVVSLNDELSKLRYMLTEKFPHREFVVKSTIDNQIHFRDGLDALCMRLAQICEAATNVQVADVDQEELKFTDPKADKTRVRDDFGLIFKDGVKKAGLTT